MKNILTFLLVILISESTWSQPLHADLTHSFIIDTDGAIDDMRAISLLLSRPEITIKAFLLSDGSLAPKDGIEKISSLLHEFNRDDIPIASGVEIESVNPPWREFNKQINWGSEKYSRNSSIKAVDCLSGELRNSEEKIILVCLGPLTNIAQMIQTEPSLCSKIERVIWYNESAKPESGFNYEYNREAAGIIFNSGVRIDVISNLKNDDARFDSSMFNVCKQSTTLLGANLYKVHNQKVVFDKLMENHFRLCDELVAIYLTNPELFDINPMMDKLKVRYNKDYSVQGVREAMYDMINGVYVSEQNVVFNRFPSQREMFNYDVRPIIDSAIARYGYEEWKANVMTDEFHGHLGVFSIVGAKMGIRAREFFGVGPDMLNVTSFAGSKPPYSCLNDGIQVSTGATLGMGTIHLASDSIIQPSAVFSYKGRSVRLTLKKEYLDKVDEDIKEGIVKFGLMDDGYWKLIRRNALKYWLEWDRNTIFDIKEVNQ